MGEFCQVVEFHCEWPANEGATISSYTAKPAERQKKLTVLGDGQSEPQQCKFQWACVLVPLTSNSPAVQATIVWLLWG